MLRTRLIPLMIGLVIGIACRVNLGDDRTFTCTSDADCGGDDYKCAAPSGGAGLCCKVTGPEICDKLDNDCNGKIDDGFGMELCNGIDDNCNGQIDEGFDLTNDLYNCGKCGAVCSTTQACVGSTCITRGETDCNDGIDNDQNGKTDCQEASCNQISCGPGCLCQALKKAEKNCIDAADNDGDSKTDCADDDCAGAGCGDGGCSCLGAKKTETACDDTVDNDGDGTADCADSDCAGQLCQASPATFRCSGATCACNDAGVVNEAAALCHDGKDNDCDGLVDCQEAACDMLSCASDGGVACKCMGGIKTEVTCNDRKDNDGDGFTDCADSDCRLNAPCTYIDSTGMVVVGQCGADKLCH